jgi:hypothetical protein
MVTNIVGRPVETCTVQLEPRRCALSIWCCHEKNGKEAAVGSRTGSAGFGRATCLGGRLDDSWAYLAGDVQSVDTGPFSQQSAEKPSNATKRNATEKANSNGSHSCREIRGRFAVLKGQRKMIGDFHSSLFG